MRPILLFFVIHVVTILSTIALVGWFVKISIKDFLNSYSVHTCPRRSENDEINRDNNITEILNSEESSNNSNNECNCKFCRARRL